MEEQPLALMAPQELPVDSPLHNIDPKITAIIPLEDLKKKIEDIQFQYTYPLCAAISLKTNGQLEICTFKAGSSTSHDGVGRCFQHDKPLFQPRSPYAKYLNKFSSLQEMFEEFQSREKKLNDLTDEMHLARTVCAMQLKEFEENKRNKNKETFDNVVQALELIRRIGESIAKIQQAEATTITMQSVTAFLWQISDILNQELLDPITRIRVLDRISTETSFTPS